MDFSSSFSPIHFGSHTGKLIWHATNIHAYKRKAPHEFFCPITEMRIAKRKKERKQETEKEKKTFAYGVILFYTKRLR